MNRADAWEWKDLYIEMPATRHIGPALEAHFMSEGFWLECEGSGGRRQAGVR